MRRKFSTIVPRNPSGISATQHIDDEHTWKSILLYQYKTGYLLFIIILIYIANVIVLVEATSLITSYKENGDYTSNNYLFYIFHLIDLLYAIDLLFRFGYVMTDWTTMKLYYEEAIGEGLIVDLISIIPIELIFLVAKQDYWITYYTLRLRALLRFFRVASINRYFIRNSKWDTFGMILFWGMSLRLFIAFLLANLHLIFYCNGSPAGDETTECTFNNYRIFASIYYVTLKSLTGVGADINMHRNITMYHIYGILNVVYMTHGLYLIARLTCVRIHKLHAQYHFVRHFANIMKIYRLMNREYRTTWSYENERIYFIIKDYYSHFMKERNGITSDILITKVLPQSMITSVYLDLAIDAFKHSHIFRNMSVDVLRYLAAQTKLEFAVPGEILVRKGDYCKQMIYICHGVLQILSTENGETSVLNLSGGTCLGEITTMINYPSACTVLCQTYCELIILTRRHFTQLCQYYPEEFRDILAVVLRRIHHAKLLKQHVNQINVHKTSLLVMQWMKDYQRMIFAGHVTPPMKAIIDNNMFYIIHLDKFVISEEFELVKDSVFLKSSFHFILQPGSKILLVWDSMVICTVIFYALFFPYIWVDTGFVSETSQKLITMPVIIIYILDVYLQVATAIKARGATYMTLSAIINARLNDFRFIMDVFAAIPIDLFIPIVTNVEPGVAVLLQSFRLVKYYKLHVFIDKFECWDTQMLIYKDFFKYCVHGMFLVYYTLIITVLLNCNYLFCTEAFRAYYDPNVLDAAWKLLADSLSIACSMLTGLNLGETPFTKPSYYFFIYILIAILSYLFRIVFLARTITTHALHYIDDLTEQERLQNILTAIDYFDIGKQFKDDINKYVDKLWYFRKRFYNEFNATNLPSDLELQYRNLHLMRILEKNKLFNHIPKDKLQKLCAKFIRVIIPAGHVVVYKAEMQVKLYIIERGFCQINEQQVVSTNYTIAALEWIKNAPVCHTVRTITDCAFITISKMNMDHFFASNPLLHKKFRIAAAPISLRLSELRRHPRFENHPHPRKLSKLEEQIKNIKVLTTASFTKIPAYSTKLLYYEIFRCFSIFLNALFGIARFWFKPNIAIFIIFDTLSLIDFILRFNITYFNNIGIEVTNTKSIISHYLSHAFLVDFLALLPFDYIFAADIIYTRLNRLLQLYRINALFIHITDCIQKIRSMRYICVLIIMALLCGYVSEMIDKSTCVYDASIPKTDRYDGGFYCYENSWLAQSIISVPISVEQSHAERFLLAISFFCGNGFRRYVFSNWIRRVVTSLWGMISYGIRILIASKIIAVTLFQNADLTMYQEAMKSLVTYLSYSRVDHVVKHEIIDHFEYIWETRKGKNIKDVIAGFPNALKLDTLYNIYENELKLHAVFQNADDAFLRGLLSIANQETFRKCGILYRVNDIHGKIFYLVKGCVEVVGPDRNRLDTLAPGALFGCLDRCELTRHTLTMVANGHVETLAFKSEEFYKLLVDFPQVAKEFRKLTAFHVDYFKSTYGPSQAKEYRDVISTQFNIAMRRYCLMRVFARNKYINGAEMMLFIIEFFVGFPHETIVTCRRPEIVDFVFFYGRDALWLLRIYIIFHLAFEDEYGMLIYNRKKIARRYMKSRFGFYFDLAASVPLDIVLLFMPFDINMYGILRLNRALRIFYLLKYGSKLIQKLNINVFLLRMIYMLMYLWIYFQFIAAFYYWSDSHWHADAPMNEYLKYVDATLFLISGTCVPFTNIFNRSAPFCLSFIMLVTLWIWITLCANVTATLQVVTKNAYKFREMYSNLTQFLKIRDTSRPLIDRISKYLITLLKVQNGEQFPMLLEEAPYYLKEAVLNSMFGYHLFNHKILKHCHTDFLRQVAATMRTITFFDSTYITYKGEIDETLYFIQEGTVRPQSDAALYDDCGGDELTSGDCFGLNQILFSRTGHYYTYKAITFTVVVTVKRAQFISLLRFFPASSKYIYQQDLDSLKF